MGLLVWVLWSNLTLCNLTKLDQINLEFVSFFILSDDPKVVRGLNLTTLSH